MFVCPVLDESVTCNPRPICHATINLQVNSLQARLPSNYTSESGILVFKTSWIELGYLHAG